MKCLKQLSGIALALFLMAGLVLPAVADEEEELEIGVWYKDVTVGLNLLQSSYTKNWNSGEKGSVNWTGNLDAKFEKQFSKSSNWRNTLKLAYGQTHQQDRLGDGLLFWKKPDKIDDVIDFESLFRWTTSSGWDPFVAFNFTSLFEDVSDGFGRTLNFNPKSFKESAGISRTWYQTDERFLMTRFGIAFIQNNRSFFSNPAPSTDTVSETSNEVAAEMITEYKTKALDGRVDWESKLTLTLPFVYSGKTTFEDDVNLVAAGLPADIADYGTTLDVDWENMFSANITSVISVKLFLRWVYDKYDNTVSPSVDADGNLVNGADVMRAIRRAGQFKQTMALGLAYKFM